jgi:leucyl-tRNA synthetase
MHQGFQGHFSYAFACLPSLFLNVINPDEIVSKFGADAVRMYLAFIGPYNEPGHYPWNLDGTLAMRKFLDRIYALSDTVGTGDVETTTKQEMARAIAKVGEEIDRFKFNTAISALMVYVRSCGWERTSRC